ncbi:MAG: hypothetical protein Q9217_005756 [Psora testacea]
MNQTSRDFKFESGWQSDNDSPRRRGPHWRKNLYIACIVTCLCMMSFVIGKRSATNSYWRGFDCVPDIETGVKEFRYNGTFGEATSKTSNAAWEALFPSHGGFFRHPDLAPERSAFSVFHQLHCLKGLKDNYWQLHSGNGQARVHDSQIMEDIPPEAHVRHCIDLIRNSLICRPDLTVETKNEELGGVTGFGTLHQCIDWNAVVAWTSKWETYEP